MTLHEKVVLSAYTGILMCDFWGPQIHRKASWEAGLVS